MLLTQAQSVMLLIRFIMAFFLYPPARHLRLFPDQHFDFIYSHITLQHIEPKLSARYIREFVRVLAPGGVLIFQLPFERIAAPGDQDRTGALRRALRSLAGAALLDLYRRVRLRARMVSGRVAFDCYEIRREEVLEILRGAGARIVDLVEDHSGGPAVRSLRYCATKP